MTADEPHPDVPHHSRLTSGPPTRSARAYTGPAHGQEWTVKDDDPAPWVELPIGASSVLYRLVRRRQTGSPARDHRGNYRYVPISEPLSTAIDDGECRVLTFPADRTAAPRSRTAEGEPSTASAATHEPPVS